MNDMFTSYPRTISTTGNVSSSTTPAPVFDEDELLLIWTVFTVIWSVGTITNLITFVVFTRMESTPLNIIISSLCVSDVISTLGSPVVVDAYLARDTDYPFGGLACKTINIVASLTSAVAIQHVFALSIWRFYAIQRPYKGATFMSLKRAKTVTICSWSITSAIYFMLASRYLNVVKSPVTGMKICFFRPEDYVAAHVFNFAVDTMLSTLLPIFGIVVCSLGIVLSLISQRKVRKSISKSDGFRKQEKLALVQVSLIIVTFLIAYLPKLIDRIWLVVANREYSSHVIMSVTAEGTRNLFAAINPIVYTL